MVDWNDLQVVRAVERAGSLSEAARALGIHQTTVGRRLRAAEEALGIPLFLRSTVGVVATPAGAHLLAALENLGGAIDALERQAHALTAGEGGLVRLAVTENAARLLLPTALTELRAQHPEITIELVPGNTAVDLSRGEADLAVRLVAIEDPDLVRRRLGEVRYGLYAGARYLAAHNLAGPREGTKNSPRKSKKNVQNVQKISLGAAEAEAFAGQSVLLPSRELAPGPEATWLRARASRATVVLHASSLVTLAEAAAAGLGLTVLPDNLARLHPDLALLRALPEIPGRPVWLVLHRDLRGVPRVRRVADAVAKALRRVNDPSPATAAT